MEQLLNARKFARLQTKPFKSKVTAKRDLFDTLFDEYCLFIV